MEQNDQMRLAMCWYDEAQWKLLKELDPDGTDDTYEVWRKSASEAFSELRASGQDIVKISIRIDELLAWCEENGYEPVSSSRSAYAAFKLQQNNERNKT
ncbi:hypothetical protein [Sedimenticola hydrogenitrophicus]|uniref:hypothetical protein n=1 Tax=Sedimenticola hydrogenitrophicus TaxID=2967975 RepID=UPI0021A3280C|nr:hypothetical protein [Sedimenticola hydrogenitrophicus]